MSFRWTEVPINTTLVFVNLIQMGIGNQGDFGLEDIHSQRFHKNADMKELYRILVDWNKRNRTFLIIIYHSIPLSLSLIEVGFPIKHLHDKRCGRRMMTVNFPININLWISLIEIRIIWRNLDIQSRFSVMTEIDVPFSNPCFRDLISCPSRCFLLFYISFKEFSMQ